MADKADKSEFVDTIGDATKQRYRRVMPRAKELVAKETPKMGHWPPVRLEQWRMENLTPWKIKPWKLKDWV
jgi:hypothetical protein